MSRRRVGKACDNRGEMPAQQMKAGELVVLRPPAEILATLDETGATAGMPFMPEMPSTTGRRFASRLGRSAPATQLSGASGESLTR